MNLYRIIYEVVLWVLILQSIWISLAGFIVRKAWPEREHGCGAGRTTARFMLATAKVGLFVSGLGLGLLVMKYAGYAR